MHGQTANTGAIAGAVSDPSGALVPRAAVVIKSQDTGEKRDLATDAEGNFSVQFLTSGNYDLTHERQAPAPPEIIACTLAYIAPEQSGRMNRSIDTRSD